MNRFGSWVLLALFLWGVSSCVVGRKVPCLTDAECNEGTNGRGRMVCYKQRECVPQWWLDKIKKPEPREVTKEPIVAETGTERVEPKTSDEPIIEPADAANELSQEELIPEAKSELEPDKNPCVGSCRLGEKRDCYSNSKGCTQNGATWDCKGICKAGTQKCAILAQGKCPEWDDCQGEVFPESKESCDQVDNNCDGQIDEDCDCKPVETQACYTKGQGCKKIAGNSFSCTTPCQVGTQACEGGKWGKECKGEIGPVTEICDGKDNDCNGSVDDNLARSCYKGPLGTENKGLCRGGSETCKAGSWGNCLGQIVPQGEICDGLDNNCNGMIDDSVTGIGKACTVLNQKGPCSKGITACKNKKMQCPQIVFSKAESCNQSDDDCDGKTDEGCVITIAGDGKSGFKDGKGTSSQFNGPSRVISDSQDNLYIADTNNHRIRKLDIQGNVTTVAGSGTAGFKDGASPIQLNYPVGLAFGIKGNFYIADSFNNRIRKIDQQNYTTTAAGDGNFGDKGGFAGSAQFGYPLELVFDKVNNFFVADSFNNKIKKVDKNDFVTTAAGDGKSGFKDGMAAQAQFNNPSALALDATGNLYIADTGNHRIRKLDTQGNVTTVAGNGTVGFKDAKAPLAQFSSPNALALDAAGNLYIADTGNHRIRKLDTQGNVTTVAGDGIDSYKDGLVLSARFNEPAGLTLDSKGDLYVTDTFNHRIRKIILP